MKPVSPLALVNPALLWMQLATQTAEMLVASAQVISVRTARMAAAGPTPNARDRREFSRMGTEKVAAAGKSAMAAGTRLPALMLATPGHSTAAWMALWGQWARLGSAALAPVHATATANARRLTQVKRKRGAARR